MFKTKVLKKKVVATIFILIFLLTGCSNNKSLPDTYVFGSDFQFYQTSGGVWNPRVQKAENGSYLVKDNFVYFYNVSFTYFYIRI